MRARSLYLSLFFVPLLPYNVLSPTLSANVDELVRGACDALKDMYRYNRVMIYRFHEDYHGTFFPFFLASLFRSSLSPFARFSP